MSVEMFGLVIDTKGERRSGVKWWRHASHKAIAMLLANIANQDGESIYPSIAYLAETSELKRRAVQYILRDLRSDGFLEPLDEGRGGRSKTRHYRINPTWIEAAQQARLSKKKGRKRCTVVSKLSTTVEQLTETVQRGAEKGANDDTKARNRLHPDPSISIRIREEAPTRASPTGSRGAPEKTKEELAADCRRLAAEGFAIDAIVQILRSYALTRDEIAAWITSAPQQT